MTVLCYFSVPVGIKVLWNRMDSKKKLESLHFIGKFSPHRFKVLQHSNKNEFLLLQGWVKITTYSNAKRISTIIPITFNSNNRCTYIKCKNGIDTILSLFPLIINKTSLTKLLNSSMKVVLFTCWTVCKCD